MYQKHCMSQYLDIKNIIRLFSTIKMNVFHYDTKLHKTLLYKTIIYFLDIK